MLLFLFLLLSISNFCLFFFFQAEDGIRDRDVTGVQTCALPILPLSIGGAIVALLLTGKQLTTPVWIGILMLMGIVTKNAIMLVEFAVEAIREGKKRDFAIIDAGIKRARPIVMTTIAMTAGMMPSALAFGAGGEFRSPMALAVIGGLVFSTILSLVFVPAMFMVMDDVGTLS